MLYSNETHPESSPVELIPKASQTAVIVQCGGIWFAGGKFGVTWKLLQAVVKPKPTMKGRCLISLTQEDKTVISAQPDTQEKDVGVAIVDDSDEEDEEPYVAPVVQQVVQQEVPVQEAPAVQQTPLVLQQAPTSVSTTKKTVLKRKL